MLMAVPNAYAMTILLALGVISLFVMKAWAVETDSVLMMVTLVKTIPAHVSMVMSLMLLAAALKLFVLLYAVQMVHVSLSMVLPSALAMTLTI
ncbi:hypothetical protein ADUPG1_003122, partial [Aduncisulcus paluster]